MTTNQTKGENMKTIQMTGADIKADNGSGYNLAPKGRRIHDRTIYNVKFNGVEPDRSNIISITRSAKGWTP